LSISRILLLLFLCSWLVSSCGKSGQKPDQRSDVPDAHEDSVQVALPDFSGISTEDVYAYSCDDSTKFSAYVTRDSTWLFTADTTLKLTPARSASGARYVSGPFLYWSKGDKALLQLASGSLKQCRVVPQEKAWQAARIRGVDFRALGQEPGWILEITNDRQLKYVGQYGGDSLSAPLPEPEKSGAGGRRYRLNTSSRNLTIDIEQTPCKDAMSGFSFPATVTVTIDGERYSGCGKALQNK